MRILVVLALAALLSACVSIEGGESGLLDRLLVATIDDATAARALAERTNDAAGQRCWTTVIAVAEERQGLDVPLARVVGPLSAWQQARNVRIFIDDGIDSRVRADCAVLVLDAIRTGRALVGRALPIL